MKKMQYRATVFATIAILLSVPAFLLVCGFLLPPRYDRTFLGELKEKCERLARTEGKRIVLVGGSSLVFGIDSGLIEENFPGYSAVNFGLYAGLGTEVMFDLSIQDIREGDIIIISPEQDAQTLSGYFNGEAMWQALDGNFPLLFRLDREDLGRMAGHFPHFAAEKWNGFRTGEAPDGQGIYRKSSFNEYGEIRSGLCLANKMPAGYDKNMKIRMDEQIISEEFLESLNRYAQAAEAKGASVWYRFCPMNERALDPGADVEGYYDWLQSRLTCNIIGDPRHCIMEPEWFYDTNFHLNESGKTVNTRQLIRDIKAMLGDSSPTVIGIPKKPEFGRETAAQGDNRDEALFLCEIEDGEARVAGLTEEGADRESITIPTSYNGLPVTVLGNTAFSGNTAIREIRIQESLRFIEDYSFEGCSSLETIRLDSAQPESCLVGHHLLEGTNADIRVKEEALSDYRTNYFWSVYADRITN